MEILLSVIIPNWNGAEFLEPCLAGVLEAADRVGASHEIIVLDDCSTDNSADLVSRHFPGIRLERNPMNIGFGGSVNRAAGLASGRFLALLNNDLRPEPDMLLRMLTPLEQDDVFGVSGKTVSWETREPNHVNMTGRFSDGHFRLAWADDSSTTDTMFLQGGSCVVRRKEFLEFGGFCHLFAPGYWEDYDISYLALKAGMRNIYEPGAVGLHRGQGSMIRAHGAERIARIRERNAIRFLALNLTDPPFLHAWMKQLPRQLSSESSLRMLHRAGNILSLGRATGKLARERSRRTRFLRVTDAEIFSRFSTRGTLC